MAHIHDKSVNANPKVRDEKKGPTWNDVMNLIRDSLTINPDAVIGYY